MGNEMLLPGKTGRNAESTPSAFLENPAAEVPAPLEGAAGPGPTVIDRAEPRDHIERDARPVAPLVHEPDPIALDHELLRHVVRAGQLNHQVAARTAARTGRNTVEVDGHAFRPVRHGPAGSSTGVRPPHGELRQQLRQGVAHG